MLPHAIRRHTASRVANGFLTGGLTMVLALIVITSMACSGEGPCVDGVQGDRLTDETATAIKLINDSNDFIHLLGSRESGDLCNRVNDRGGSRFIFVAEDRIAYTVRAFTLGQVVDEITCTLPEEMTVRYSADPTMGNTLRLICVNDGG